MPIFRAHTTEYGGNTMDFEEFREKLKEDLGERLFTRTGDDFEITSSSVNKLQNASS